MCMYKFIKGSRILTEKKELECPSCSALIDVSEMETYEMFDCHECKTELEYIGDGEIIIS
jgi:uncharacterized paraquat-inducible protein A